MIMLAAGQKMWANRFGDLTALRWPVRSNVSADAAIKNLTAHLLANLPPEEFGFRLDPVRERALKSAEQSQDFGGLFLGFSLFLIVAALLLMALLFQFGIEQRATEVGTLLALGFTPGQVRRLLLLEGGALALGGGLIGVAGGVGYARAMLLGLSTVWHDAVQTSALGCHAEPQTLAIGSATAVLVAWLTIWLALRKQARQPARELLAEGDAPEFRISNLQSRKPSRAGIISAVAGMIGLSWIGWAVWRGETADAETFFGASTVLLIAELAASAILLAA